MLLQTSKITVYLILCKITKIYSRLSSIKAPEILTQQEKIYHIEII
jgi:hypothetical protein